MENLTTQLQELAQQKPQGFTVNLDCEIITSGIVVAFLETQNSFGIEGLKKVVEFATLNNTSIGFWEGYWDAVLVLNNREQAIELGKKNEQTAIFDIDNQELIFL